MARTSTSPRKSNRRTKPLKERRASASDDQGVSGSLRKLKGALNRPIALERRDGKLQILAERRVKPPAEGSLSMAQMCAEITARLLVHEPEREARAMLHLVLVHDALESHGWAGIEGLSSHVLGKALAQAKRLAGRDPTPPLTMLIEGLRPLQQAAVLREHREARLYNMQAAENYEIESDYAGLDDVETQWPGTAPAGLVPMTPKRDD